MLRLATSERSLAPTNWYDNAPIDKVENQEEDIYDQDYNEMDDINFPTSDLTEEEDQVYYYDN